MKKPDCSTHFVAVLLKQKGEEQQQGKKKKQKRMKGEWSKSLECFSFSKSTEVGKKERRTRSEVKKRIFEIEAKSFVEVKKLVEEKKQSAGEMELA